MKIFLSAGEPSGDVHAAALIRKVKELAPDTEFTGFGGPKMQEAGCELVADLTKYAIMWVWHALKQYFRFRRYIAQARRLFRKEQFDAVVLIDFPGFNWHIARAAKERRIPVVYFMPPQLWAWGRWRIKKMRMSVDLVLCPLHFEWQWFRQQYCNAVFIGHPFFEEIRTKKSDTAFLSRFYAEFGTVPILTILAGSRRQEIALNLDDLLRTVERMQKKGIKFQPVFAAFNEELAAKIRRRLNEWRIKIPIFVGQTTELIRAADCCLAVSGSVSLELLACSKPTVIYYRVGCLPHLIQRFFRRTKYITLVNLIGVSKLRGQTPFYEDSVSVIPKEPNEQDRNCMFFPEFLTARNRSKAAAEILTVWFSSPKELARQKYWLEALLEKTDIIDSPLELAAKNILDIEHTKDVPLL